MSVISEQVSTSLEALTKEYEIITHNLANVSTAGYKRRCNAFSKVLESRVTDPQAYSYSPGSVEMETSFDFSQGNIVQTDRKLDCALYGKGFFQIETPDGALYTRSGIFNVDPNGQVIDFQGRIVSGQAGPITIPGDVAISEIKISSDGSISADGTNIGQFKLVDFGDDENKLAPVGGSCYLMTDPEIEPVSAENVIVKQGCQEASNVQIIDELVDLLMVSRFYEANMDFLNSGKETTGNLISVAMG
jgi:flagellar basal body rod protein FlgG